MAERPSAKRVSSAVDIITSQTSTVEIDAIDPDEPDLGSEPQQIMLDIKEIIGCLFRVSMAIRNPAPHDHFTRTVALDHDYFEVFDVQHVQSKFPRASATLAERLGKAISRRRLYLKYRADHHSKLAYGMTEDNEGLLDNVSTVASSLPQLLPANFSSTEFLDDGDGRASIYSVTSYATTTEGSIRSRIPPPPKGALSDLPFECPICYQLTVCSDRLSWK